MTPTSRLRSRFLVQRKSVMTGLEVYRAQTKSQDHEAVEDKENHGWRVGRSLRHHACDHLDSNFTPGQLSHMSLRGILVSGPGSGPNRGLRYGHDDVARQGQGAISGEPTTGLHRRP